MTYIKHGLISKKLELAFTMIKPDGFKRGLSGKIINKLQESGLELCIIKSLQPTSKLALGHFRRKNGSSGVTKKQVIDYLTTDKVIIMLWNGENAVEKLRNICGDNTDPNLCNEGTIRKETANDSIEIAHQEERACHNVVHSSNNPHSALYEAANWFTKKELKDYVEFGKNQEVEQRGSNEPVGGSPDQ